jgi:Inner membrane component of T3SS, cytoplasmic domain
MLTNSDLDAGATKWHLLVREGADAGRIVELPMGVPVRVGAAADNQLTLKDPGVSPHHVTIRLEVDGAHVADLHAQSRTSVGPLRVSDAVVPAGALLRIGDTVLLVEARAAGASVTIPVSDAPAPRPYGDSRRDAILAFEARYLADLVRLAGGNASHAARIAQMDRPHLLRLLRKHQLRSPGAASTVPPHSQVVVRENAATDPAELASPEARAMAVGETPTAAALGAPRLPRIDYTGR